jgi:hypothetical protein
VKRYVCAVFDSAVMAYGQPFFVPAIGAALRSFTDEVNRKASDNALSQHPEDYTLHVLATFDDETGRFDSDADTFRVLARGKDIVTGGQ